MFHELISLSAYQHNHNDLIISWHYDLITLWAYDINFEPLSLSFSYGGSTSSLLIPSWVNSFNTREIE